MTTANPMSRRLNALARRVQAEAATCARPGQEASLDEIAAALRDLGTAFGLDVNDIRTADPNPIAGLRYLVADMGAYVDDAREDGEDEPQVADFLRRLRLLVGSLPTSSAASGGVTPEPTKET